MNEVPVAKLGDPMEIGAILALARDLGATRVENMGGFDHRVLCALLRHHVFEHQHALGRTAQQRAARIKAISTAQSIAIMVRNVRVRRPDPERERLAGWLAIERTKLLMASKADAIASLNRVLFKSRRQLPEAATAAVRGVSLEVLAPFHQRVSVETAKPLAAFAKRLVTELEDALADLGELLSPDAMAGIELLPEVHAERGSIMSSARSIGGAAAKLGLVTRRRLEEASRSALVDELELGSFRATKHALDAYDGALIEIDRRFCELLVGLVDSVERASELADQAQRGGKDAVARAYRQVADWSARLPEISNGLG